MLPSRLSSRRCRGVRSEGLEQEEGPFQFQQQEDIRLNQRYRANALDSSEAIACMNCSVLM